MPVDECLQGPVQRFNIDRAANPRGASYVISHAIGRDLLQKPQASLTMRERILIEVFRVPLPRPRFRFKPPRCGRFERRRSQIL